MPTQRQHNLHKHTPTAVEKQHARTPEELLAYLASQPLSRAFPVLVKSLPEALPEPPGNHDVLLGCTALLLRGCKGASRVRRRRSPWPSWGLAAAPPVPAASAVLYRRRRVLVRVEHHWLQRGG